MIYTTEHSAKILKAMNDVTASNNGYADIGHNPDIANALFLAGFVVIESTNLHGNPTFKAFTKRAQEALRFSQFGESTYRAPTATSNQYGGDIEGAILARQESAGFFD